MNLPLSLNASVPEKKLDPENSPETLKWPDCEKQPVPVKYDVLEKSLVFENSPVFVKYPVGEKILDRVNSPVLLKSSDCEKYPVPEKKPVCVK